MVNVCHDADLLAYAQFGVRHYQHEQGAGFDHGQLCTLYTASDAGIHVRLWRCTADGILVAERAKQLWQAQFFLVSPQRIP